MTTVTTVIMRPKRTVKSFVRRLGELSPAQKAILEQTKDEIYFVNGACQQLSSKLLACLAEHPRSVVLDIGFGDGTTLLHMARQEQDSFIIGVEPHRAGISQVLLAAEKSKMTNILCYEGDIKDLLEEFHQKNISIQRAHLYFPDPWPKKRHHKRRLIQKDFLNLLHKVMMPQSLFFIATDWEPYATHMQEVFHDSQEIFRSVEVAAANNQFQRPLTKYEKRGIEKGHQIFDFILQAI